MTVTRLTNRTAQMRRLLAAALAALFLLGSVAVGSTVSARSFQPPARTTVQAQRVAHAVTVGHKKKKKHHKKAAVVKDSYPLACVGKADAASGDWSGAENQYEAAESATKNFSAVSAFATLGLDAAAVALDQLSSSSTTTDVTNYNQDLSAYASYFKGCPS
jgi:hypothetical protein